MKVCFVAGYFNYFSNKSKSQGGAEYQSYLLSQYLLKNNCDVFFISPGDRDEFVLKDGIKIYFIRKRSLLKKFGNYFLFDFFRILKLLKKIDPDIVYQRTGTAYTGISAYYCKKNNKKMIWAIGSQKDVEKFNFRSNHKVILNSIDKVICWYGIRNANCILGQAYYQNELLKKNFKRECDYIIPNCHPLPTAPIKKRMDIIKIVWIANFSENKNPQIFIDLAESFIDQKHLSFTMIGRPYQEKKQALFLKRISSSLNLSYLGALSQDRVNEILSESHILVNTSYQEGFPNTFIQAWLRKVIVMTLNVDPDNIIKTRKLGFHSGNLAQMKRDIHNLCSDINTLTNMSEHVFKYAVENHSLKSVASLFDKIFMI